MTQKALVLLALSSALLAGTARANVEISSKPTANMSCSAGVCTATAKKAVLNAANLANMLASGDVTVNTDGSLAKDIDIDTAFSWTGTSRLTLDAYQSVTVKKPITVAGTGALTVTANDGGKNGEFVFMPHGSVQFWDLASSLIIDGNSYTLAGDIKTLASDIAANPAGFYALAKDYDASADGTYQSSPIAARLTGTFEGLGNQISNFALGIATLEVGSGLFAGLERHGTIRDMRMVDAHLSNGEPSGVGGALIGDNEGLLERCSATGTMDIPGGAGFGGLVAANGGKITQSYAVMQIRGTDAKIGGLVGGNYGLITQSYSAGSIFSKGESGTIAGGLVGDNAGTIRDTYSTSSVHNGPRNCCDFGGLVGRNEGTISTSYSVGKTSQSKNAFRSFIGGVIGEDKAAAGSIASSYWDLDIGIDDPSQGAGNIQNDPGIEGLTTAQFQAGLPTGFDPKICSEDQDRNHGFPDLINLH